MKRLVILLLIAGCAASQPKPVDAPDVSIESWETIDVAQLNMQIEEGITAGAAWAMSPLGITIELLGGDADTRYLSVTEEKNRTEGADTTVVIMVRDGFLDDSVRGDWHRIVYRLEADRAWRVHRVKRAFRCWRGHHLETYSSKLCL
jgi:hypothetical protein